MKIYRFKVKGVGRFPLDMLRYDSCWPASEEDAGRIGDTFDGVGKKVIELAGINKPATDRWNSFLWDVDDRV